MEYKIVLASASPRRKLLFKNVGIVPEIIVSLAEENVDIKGLVPEDAVQKLAVEKGKAVLSEITTDELCFIVSADTVVASGDTILGKPINRENAYEMLKTLSGKSHKVITGFSIIRRGGGLPDKSVTSYETTVVKFKKLDENDINNYLDTGEYTDKAGAYGIQGKGAFLVSGIEGDYFNVVGFPLSKFFDIMKKLFDVNIY